ncbi:hypothetical protein ILYODFUR_034544 [Ilyodon furcidens]|uniref:Uncharacterized protein n=1 Tax=Ilyodon furcidens TaxID=33524 RepID=A0ABV0U1X1_9TELE
MTSSSCGRLYFLSCLRKYSLCWFFRTVSMCEDHLRFREMVVARNRKWSTVDSVIEDGEGGMWAWCSPKVPHHLHSLEWVKFQVFLTTPMYQLIHLLSLCRLTIVLDQTNNSCVICKLQEFHRLVR